MRVTAVVAGGWAALLLATGASAAAGQPAKTITIDKLAFAPAPAALRVGDTVVWSNRDMFQHSATARDGSFDLNLKPGASARVRLTRPGVIRYYCRFHPGMTGELRVLR